MNYLVRYLDRPLLCSFLGLVLASGGTSAAMGATASNSRSPLGMNLQPVNYFTSEQPFLNIFKTTWISKTNPQGWQTHRVSASVFDTGEGAYVQTDADGYPTTLTPSPSDPNSTPFSSVGVIFLYNLGKSDAGIGQNYPAGRYVVLYDGQGTLSYGNDARLVSSSRGRDVFDVANPTYGGGIDLRITATDPEHTGNYLRAIRVVKAENEDLLANGETFNPDFLNLLRNFRVLRGMQWLQIDDEGGFVKNWAARPHLSDAGWGGPNGTPIEVLLELCNAIDADCWLNIPHAANDEYITRLAVLTHKMLGSNQKTYVEISNEVWNSGFAQFAYANTQGRLRWPGAGPKADVGSNWYGMRVAQACDIWKAIWSKDAPRVVCVMGAFTPAPWSATEALSCPLWRGAGNAPCSEHGIGAVAIAPYFANIRAEISWLMAPDVGLRRLFAAIDVDLRTTSTSEAAFMDALDAYHLPLIAYEGGQSLVSDQVSDPNGAIKNLYVLANRIPRMGAAYTAALHDWKSNGGQLYVLYADIARPTKYGEWGALESVWDTVSPLSSAPPKWQAIQDFIAANPCWWRGCAGATASAAGSARPHTQ